MGRTKIDAPSWRHLKAEYETGLTGQDLANKYQVDRKTIYNWFIRFGIPRRSISDTAILVMSRRTHERKLEITAASRSIITGKKRSHADLCKRALGKERTATPSKYEKELLDGLKANGWRPVLHKAVDKFNVALAFPDHLLAIEVHGGNWHATSKRKIEQDQRKREALTIEGWRLIEVRTRSKHWLVNALSVILKSL